MTSSIATTGPQRLLTPPLPMRPETLAIEPRQTAKTGKEMRAEWLAAHPILSPQEALASNAELGPAYDGNTRADNHISKLHTEIKVNGKTIARVYNSGSMEIADEYRFLSEELDFGSDRIVGPDLAEDRAKRVVAALERHGAIPKEKLDANGLLAAATARVPTVELLRASTAQTQEEWLDFKATEGPMPTGSFFSRSA